MKKLIFILFSWLCIQQVWAQEERVSQYIFPDFEMGIVKFKTGSDLKANLNYNTLTEEMFFKKGDSAFVLAETQKIDAIYIKDRKFIPVDEVFYEEIPAKNLSLFIRHIATLNAAAVNTGYGTTKNTSQTTLSSLRQVNGTYNFALLKYDIQRKEEFYLKQRQKYVHIKSANSFDQFFSNQSKEIKNFIAANQIDLAKSKDVIKLIDNFSK
jgi:hypothetical protein